MLLSRINWIAVVIGLTLLLVCCSEPIEAADLVELNEVSIQYKNFVSDGRDLLVYPEVHREALSLNVNTNFLSVLFWNNSIHTITTEAQYRSVGLESRLGVRISRYLEVSYYHFSQHLLDRASATLPRFPVSDAVEVKLIIYGGQNQRSIF